jgi:hypothetical protein
MTQLDLYQSNLIGERIAFASNLSQKLTSVQRSQLGGPGHFEKRESVLLIARQEGCRVLCDNATYRPRGQSP